MEISKELRLSLDDYDKQIYPGRNLKRHSPNEVYRRYLDYVLARLGSARSEPADRNAYHESDDFARDLHLVRESLAANGGERLARSLLDPLLRQVETFGFHLHTLDIRQHSRVHSHALEEISRLAVLQEAGASDGGTLGLPEPPSTETASLLDALRMISVLKRTYPPQAIRSYVISGTRSAADVLSLIGLAELSGVRVAAADDGTDPGLIPVPLFDSCEHFPTSPPICRALWTDPAN